MHTLASEVDGEQNRAIRRVNIGLLEKCTLEMLALNSNLTERDLGSCRIIRYQFSVCEPRGLVMCWWYRVCNLTLTVCGTSENNRRIKSEVNTQCKNKLNQIHK